MSICASVIRTHHLLHQILHNEALLLRANVGHPHPAIVQFIVNNKHVPFQEAGVKESIEHNDSKRDIYIIAEHVGKVQNIQIYTDTHTNIHVFKI